MTNNSIPQKIAYSFAIYTGVTMGFAHIQLSGSDIIIVKVLFYLIWTVMLHILSFK